MVLRDNWIKCFTENKKNRTLYIGTSNGVYTTTTQSQKAIRTTSGFKKLNNDLKNERLNDLSWHPKINILLFASNAGSGFVRGKKTIFFDHDIEFRNVAFKDSIIWFGSVDKGVLEIKFINDSVFESAWLNKDKLLISDNIYQLTEDYPNLWIGSEKGLSQYNIIDREIKHFGYDEGFEGVETNVNASFKDSDGQLWFGTTDGLFLYGKGQNYDSFTTFTTNILI